ARGEVPVEAVGGDVDLAAVEPARPRQLPVEDLLPRLAPGQLGSRGLSPERLRLVDRSAVKPLRPRGGLDERPGPERPPRGKPPRLARHRLNDARGVPPVVPVFLGHALLQGFREGQVMSKLARSPAGVSHSGSTNVTCADGGPWCNQPRKASTAASSPSARTR